MNPIFKRIAVASVAAVTMSLSAQASAATLITINSDGAGSAAADTGLGTFSLFFNFAAPANSSSTYYITSNPTKSGGATLSSGSLYAGMLGSLADVTSSPLLSGDLSITGKKILAYSIYGETDEALPVSFYTLVVNGYGSAAGQVTANVSFELAPVVTPPVETPPVLPPVETPIPPAETPPALPPVITPPVEPPVTPPTTPEEPPVVTPPVEPPVVIPPVLTPPADPILDPTPAVPESATWLMMLTGFGAIGASMRRRKTVKTSVRFA